MTVVAITQLNPYGVFFGHSTSGWALVPRYGFWSGPSWGLPNQRSLGFWYGPYGDQNVIEAATLRHDRDATKAGADRVLSRDVLSRHDLGPYGEVYRVLLIGALGALIGLGFDD